MNLDSVTDVHSFPDGRVQADVDGGFEDVTVSEKTLNGSAQCLIDKQDTKGLLSQADIVFRAAEKYNFSLGTGKIKVLTHRSTSIVALDCVADVGLFNDGRFAAKSTEMGWVEVRIFMNTLKQAAQLLIDNFDTEGLMSQADIVHRASKKYGYGEGYEESKVLSHEQTVEEEEDEDW